MMRVSTLKTMAGTRRSVFRLRRHVVFGLPVSDRDRDGRDSNPDTWERWGEEYFVQLRTAELAARRDQWKELRPMGVIDQLPAADAWALYLDTPWLWREDEAQSEPTAFASGRHRLVPELERKNAAIVK